MLTAARIRPIRTFSEAWLDRHRQTHATHAVFGTHRHPYLSDMITELAERAAGPERPSMLDYGCGKGVFLRQMAQSGLFRYVKGYDPAVDAFKTRPTQLYDLVVCLDVLDQIEDEFVEATIRDVAQLTGRFALFDVITVQTPTLALIEPRSGDTWQRIIGGHMRISEAAARPATAEELAQGACPERTIIIAAPRAA